MTAGIPVRFVVNTQCAVLRDGKFLVITRGAAVKHASGVLGFPGGKVDSGDEPDSVLESTVRREVLEETGISISEEIEYVRSTAFNLVDGTPVVDVLFLGNYKAGEPRIVDPGEVDGINWMTADEILAHERTPPWLVDQVGAVTRHLRRRNRP
ncbi:MAG: NUDIX hydrolase [Chloroflexi bacterium]|nr:NUDIX hydrolase [Chloroflexota bacterium]